MNKRAHVMRGKALLAVVAGLFLLFASCSDDYQVVGVKSPGPGTLRVLLKADESDNFLVFGGDTVRTQDGGTDSLALAVGQGRAYRGGDFAVLYKSFQDYQEVTKFFNPIRRENGAFVETTIFETHLPPASYDSLKIALMADVLRLGLYSIPLAPTSEAGALVKFTDPFRIEEGRTTVVRLRLNPFASLHRVQDTYQYDWVISVSQIEYR